MIIALGRRCGMCRLASSNLETWVTVCVRGQREQRPTRTVERDRAIEGEREGGGTDEERGRMMEREGGGRGRERG